MENVTQNLRLALIAALATLFVGLSWMRVNGQVSTYSYTPNALSASYTALSTGTTIVSGANVSGTTSNAYYQGGSANTAGSGIPIGFTFTYNCANYTTLGVHTNAFVWFGSGTPLPATTATISNASANLGGTGVIDGVIANWSGSLASTPRIPVGASSYIRYRTDGAAPNRIFKIEWGGYKMTGTSNGSGLIPSSQIWLYETSNVIEMYFNNQNSIFINGTRVGQCGLRGASNADFRNLSFTTASTWANIPAGSANTQTIQTSSSPACWPNPNRMVSWTPTLSCCTVPTTQASISAPTGITASSATLNWTPGSGTGGELVVVRSGVQTNPSSGTGYTANASFGSGSALGSGFVVAAGIGSSVTVTNLQSNTTYSYDVYTFTSSGFCYKTPGASGTFTTSNGPATYTSSTTTQVTGNVTQGSTNQAVIQVQVVVSGGTAPSLSLSSLTFNTTGSTNISSDAAAARVWYTGNSSTFATTTQFGSTVSSPSGSHTVSGTQVLAPGTNYFWVAYDLPISATIGNVLDAQCTDINYGASATPTVTAPAGSRTIVSPGSFSCAYTGSSQSIPFATIVGTGATTTVASGLIDDVNYPGQTLPFAFNFNDVNYSSFGINSNGYIWFGSGSPSTTVYNPIGNASANLGGTGTISGVIAAAGSDLIDHDFLSAAPTPAQINTKVTGTAPNRIMTIEWTGFVAFSVASLYTCNSFLGSLDESRLDFQIRLY